MLRPQRRDRRQGGNFACDLHRLLSNLGLPSRNDAADKSEPVGRRCVEEAAGEGELSCKRVVARQFRESLEDSDVGRKPYGHLLQQRCIAEYQPDSVAINRQASLALIENFASTEQSRTSHAEMMSRPRPMQTPCTATMIGTRHAAMLLIASWKSCRRRTGSVGQAGAHRAQVG